MNDALRRLRDRRVKREASKPPPPKPRREPSEPTEEDRWREAVAMRQGSTSLMARVVWNPEREHRSEHRAGLTRGAFHPWG